MSAAVTLLGRELQRDFGAEQHEIPGMLDHYQALAYALGYRDETRMGIGDWLRGQGHDPDNLWRAALERVRDAAGPAAISIVM